MNSIVSEQITTLRKEKKLTQQKLAQKLNVSTAAVCKWETGASIPDINILCKMADYFNVSVDYLLGREIKTTKCVVLCNKKNCEKMLKKCVEEQGLELQSYVGSMLELEIFLEETNKDIPLVISFSTRDLLSVHIKKLEELKKLHGFKLISIQTETESEFEDTLGIYLKCFKYHG